MFSYKNGQKECQSIPAENIFNVCTGKEKGMKGERGLSYQADLMRNSA